MRLSAVVNKSDEVAIPEFRTGVLYIDSDGDVFLLVPNENRFQKYYLTNDYGLFDTIWTAAELVEDKVRIFTGQLTLQNEN